MIRLLRGCGLEGERSARAPAWRGATTCYLFVTLEWRGKGRAGEVWKARKMSWKRGGRIASCVPEAIRPRLPGDGVRGTHGAAAGAPRW